MTRFEVDSAQVHAAGGAVMVSVGVIGAEADRLTRGMLELQNSWRGQASSQFQVVAENWRAAQEQLKASLEQISQALSVAATTYADAESANLRMFAP